MNALKHALALLGILLVGCSTISTRIQEQQAAFQSLSPANRDLVSHGKIRPGMSKAAVYIAWGKADQIAHTVSRGRAIDTWTYYAYEQEPIYDYDLYPYVVGRHVMYYPSFRPYYVSHPYPYKRVTFENGKVIGWDVTAFR